MGSSPKLASSLKYFHAPCRVWDWEQECMNTLRGCPGDIRDPVGTRTNSRESLALAGSAALQLSIWPLANFLSDSPAQQVVSS